MPSRQPHAVKMRLSSQRFCGLAEMKRVNGRRERVREKERRRERRRERHEQEVNGMI